MRQYPQYGEGQACANFRGEKWGVLPQQAGAGGPSSHDVRYPEIKSYQTITSVGKFAGQKRFRRPQVLPRFVTRAGLNLPMDEIQ